MIRYADDLVALCHSGEQAEQIKVQLAEWLAPRGLVFNEDKTKIVPLCEKDSISWDSMSAGTAPNC